MRTMESELSTLFLDHSTAKMAQMAGVITTCLKALTDEQVWSRRAAHENAVGNLVLHLCGNIDQWIGHTLGGAPDVRNRPEEFATKERLTTEELTTAINGSVDHAIAIVGALTPERLISRVTTQDGERSVLGVVYQVVGHCSSTPGKSCG